MASPVAASTGSGTGAGFVSLKGKERQGSLVHEGPSPHGAKQGGRGLELVIWSHGHVAKPIEIYKGKPVFHGLANFSLLPKGPRGEFYDGSKTFDSCRTQIAKLVVEEGAITRVSFIPCWIDERLTPEPTPPSDGRLAEFVRFMEWSNQFARLDTKFEVDEDEIVVAL